MRSAVPPRVSTTPLGSSTAHAVVIAGGQHPRTVLLGAQGATGYLPVCDHYSGIEARMVKSLQLQADMLQEFGRAQAATNFIANGARRRVGVRVHSVDHPAFEADVQTIVGTAADSLSYVMVPKVECLADVQRAVAAIDTAMPADAAGIQTLPLHVLIESPAAVHRVFEIAAHPRVQSISFGLMDFVSSHGGAIPASAMTVRPSTDNTSLDQFHHPLVVRAKTEISSACHAFGKVPSHCVVTEFRDTIALKHAARKAASAMGFTRMWSIHPEQIRPILEAFSPSPAEVDTAVRIVLQA